METTHLIIKQWTAMSFSWRLLRDRRYSWYYLERDGKIIREGNDRKELLSLGWYD